MVLDPSEEPGFHHLHVPFPGLGMTDFPGYSGSEAAGVSEVPPDPSAETQSEAAARAPASATAPTPVAAPEEALEAPVEAPAPAEVEELHDQPPPETAETGEPNHPPWSSIWQRKTASILLLRTP